MLTGMKRIIKLVGALLLLLFVITGGYVAYVFIDYHRLPDMDMESPFPYDHGGEALATAEPYRVVTWNLGFGAYSDDYSFFMDGGKESRAFSREAVLGISAMLSGCSTGWTRLSSCCRRSTLIPRAAIGLTRSG
jgi:hypothetical protein